ncbi:hypothetical protein TNCV_4145941 [Trichonephila clavipes]|nr:hypothetical protein TNCV_4145941 [Trichonephila clavipes]
MTEEKLIDHIISRKIRGSSWESRDIKPNENNRFPNRNRQENCRETRGNNRYADNSRPRREFNRFESQGVVDNQRFDVDPEVVNRIIDSAIKAVDRVVQGIVLSGVRMIETDI